MAEHSELQFAPNPSGDPDSDEEIEDEVEDYIGNLITTKPKTVVTDRLSALALQILWDRGVHFLVNLFNACSDSPTFL